MYGISRHLVFPNFTKVGYEMALQRKYQLMNTGELFYLAPIGEHDDSKTIIKLNKSGAFIWKLLYAYDSREDMVKAFCAQYDITEVRAREEIERFISFCKTHLLI